MAAAPSGSSGLQPPHTLPPPSRQGSIAVPFSPVEGPDAWFGREQRQLQHEWRHELTAAEVAELEAAADAAQRRLGLRRCGNYLAGLMALRDAAGFPLPLLSPVLARMRHELTAGRGFFLMRGLPVQRWSRQQTLVALWGLGLHVGVAIPSNQKGHLISHVRDVGVDPLASNPATRIYLTRAAQPWHVDSCDVVGLLCLSQAKSGGGSSWASSTTIVNEMLRSNPGVVATLAGKWLLDRKGELPDGKAPVFELPIAHYHKGFLTVSYHDSYYQAAAARFPEHAPALTAAQREALCLFNRTASRDDVRLDWQLAPGDLQWLNNHTNVHMREQFEDFEEPEKKRHLLRLSMVVPGLRPLPPAFGELWGPMVADDRCAALLGQLEDAALSAGRGGEPAAGDGDAGAMRRQLAARFGGSGMGCVPLDAEVGNRLEG